MYFPEEFPEKVPDSARQYHTKPLDLTQTLSFLSRNLTQTLSFLKPILATEDMLSTFDLSIALKIVDAQL